MLLDRGALDDAERHARLALKTNPQGAHELLAHVAMRRRDPEAALFEARLSENDFLLATIHLMRDEPREALLLLQRVHERTRTQKTPLPRGYYVLTGDVFLRLGRHREARIAFERALQIRSDDAVARERLEMLRESGTG